MRIERRFTEDGQSPYDLIEFRTAASEIRNPDGSSVFQMDDVEVPAQWSQVATDIIAQKYFRKAGVPQRLKAIEENTVPSWLWRHTADEEALGKLPENERYGPEKSSRQGRRMIENFINQVTASVAGRQTALTEGRP